LISEAVNKIELDTARSTGLLFWVDVPWWINEVGTWFHRPNLRISPSSPPEARNTVGAAILSE